MKNDDDLLYLRTLYASAEREHTRWLGIYKEVYSYAMPNRSLWDAYNTQPSIISGSLKAGQDVGNFDSTAALCTDAFVAKTLVSLFPAGNNWFNLSSEVDDPDVLKALDKATNLIFKNIRKSNFYYTVGEGCYDLVAGTINISTMYSGNVNNPLYFETVPLPYLMPFENSKKVLSNVFRIVNNIMNKDLPFVYPSANFKDIQHIIKNEPCGFTKLIECWIDNEDGTFSFTLCSDEIGCYYAKEKRNYMPFTIGRWSRLTGESYGRGPLIAALPDLRELNYLIMLQTKANELAALSPQIMSVGSGDINSYNISKDPGAINIIQQSIGQEAPHIEPLFKATPQQGVSERIAYLENNIRRALFDDPIANQSEPGTTATEIRLRAQWYSQITGAPAARIQSEFQNPVVEKIVKIHLVHNIDGVRDILKGIPQQSIEYQSPLVANQRQMDIESISEKAQMIGQLLGPQAAGAIVDPTKAVSAINKAIRGPDVFKDQYEIADLQQRNQQMALATHLASLQQQSPPNLPQAPNTLPSSQPPTPMPPMQPGSSQ